MDKKNRRHVAYSGVKGAYAHIAASKIFTDEEYISKPSFKSVYDAVENEECEYGVLPIENSFAGDVAQVMDLLYFGNLYIIGIYEMPIKHCLLGIPSSNIEDIKEVLSHPQALDQCAEFIQKNNLSQNIAVNTAVAAKSISEKNDPSFAAIASRETAKIYGLKILASDIHTSNDNMTRFVVISKKNEPLIDEKNAFSLILTVKNEAGAFTKAVAAIGDNGFNMRAIRSRPAKSLAWKYYFYIEGEGNIESEMGRRMKEELSKNCETVRVLGNYAEDIVLD